MELRKRNESEKMLLLPIRICEFVLSSSGGQWSLVIDS